MKEFFVKVTGVTFENRQRTIAGLRCGDQLKFVADPTNLYDHNAVEVETVNGDQVGFCKW